MSFAEETEQLNGVLDDLYGTTEFGEDDVQPGQGGLVDKEGYFHVVVNGTKRENEDHEGLHAACRVDLMVVAGTEEDQIGKKILHHARFFKVLKEDDGSGKKVPVGREAYGENYVKQACRCAYALQLVDQANIPVAKALGANWEGAEGQQCIVKVSASKDKDRDGNERTRYEIGFGNFWRLDDEEVKDCPKNGDMISAFTDGAGLGGDDDDDI